MLTPVRALSLAVAFFLDTYTRERWVASPMPYSC